MNLNEAIEVLGDLVSRAGGEGDEALDVVKDVASAMKEIAELPHVRLTVPVNGTCGLGADDALEAAKIAREALGETALSWRHGSRVEGVEWSDQTPTKAQESA